MVDDMTYTVCPVCRGEKKICRSEKKVTGGIDCPCVRSRHPGWAATGLTLAQVDRMVERQRCLQGDPGVPFDVRRRTLRDLLVRAKRGLQALAAGRP